MSDTKLNAKSESEIQNSALKEYPAIKVDYTLDECELCWGNDELTELFYRAMYIRMNLFEFPSRELFDNYGTVQKNGITYIRSGISFESFYDRITEVLTLRYASELFDNFEFMYTDVDGELCFAYGERGTEVGFKSIKFQIAEETSERIVINGVAIYCNPDNEDEESLSEYTYNVVMTENGWRFDNFDLWI